MRLRLCTFTFASALALGQTAPAGRDAAAVAKDVLDNVKQVQAYTAQLLQELGKPQPDKAALGRLVEESAKKAKEIRKLIEDLDVFYIKLPEAQQGALRRSWSVATILNGCVESAQDSLAGSAQEAAGEVRSGVECAARRASQLEEVLAPFRQR